MTIIQAYAPTTDAKKEELDEFYSQMQFEIKTKTKHPKYIKLRHHSKYPT